MTQGALFYMLGFGQRDIVPAKFELTQEPLLVLVDDLAARVDWPPALQYLIDDLSQELIKQGAAGKIIPRRTLANIRRDHSEYDKLSAQQIGRLAGAEQVLWIEVREYFANPDIFEPTNAAYYAVGVKVIDPHEKAERSRVRLWPTSPRGQYVNATLPSDIVHRAGTRDAIARKLATELASKTAKLFYDYRPGDFERVE